MFFVCLEKMLSRNCLALVTFLALAATAYGVSLKQQTEAENSLQNTDSSSSEETQEEYESLVNAVQRGLLAQMLLQQRLRSKQNMQLGEEGSRLEKRFPKWRSGETRSRVRLLHQNHDFGEFGSSNGDSGFNPPLRKIWEKNMREKNKMYESLLG